jgi:hypothetical protein
MLEELRALLLSPLRRLQSRLNGKGMLIERFAARSWCRG